MRRALALATTVVIGATTLPGQQQSSLGSSRPHSILPTLTRVFMAANDGVTGVELWEWSAATGAVQRANVFADGSGIRSSYPDELTTTHGIFGGALLFAATDGTEGRELWVWNGTSAQALPIRPGPAGSHPAGLTAVSARVFLTAVASGSSGRRLFESDGSTVAPVAAAAGLRDPYGLSAAGTRLVFAATAAGVTEAYALDATSLTIAAARPASNVPTYLDPGPFVSAVGGVYFAATVSGMRRLVRWDLTNPPQPVSFPGGVDVHPDSLTTGFFEVATRARTTAGLQLFLVSGTTARAVTSFAPGAAATISNVTGNPSGFWFTARDGGSRELWFAPTAGNSASALPPLAATGDTFPRFLHATETGVTFVADDLDGLEPWTATPTTVSKTADLRSGELGAAPGDLVRALTGSWFAAEVGNGRELWRDNGGLPAEIDINPQTPAAVDAHIEPKTDFPLRVELTLVQPPSTPGALIVSLSPTAPVALPALNGIVRGLLMTLGGAAQVIPVVAPPSGVTRLDVDLATFTGTCGSPAALAAQLLGGLVPPFDVSEPKTIVQGCATIGNARIDTLGSYDDKTGEYKIRVERRVASPPGSQPVHYLALAKRITQTGELILLQSTAIADGETLWLQGEIDLQLPIADTDPPGNRLYLLFVPTAPTQESIQTFAPSALGWFSYC
ncbi:MAG: hypothetical protein IPM29_06250 [Planctomycetes bacterium]|nr:hypothetical protein [Planctomycetota bacterium]